MFFLYHSIFSILIVSSSAFAGGGAGTLPEPVKYLDGFKVQHEKFSLEVISLREANVIGSYGFPFDFKNNTKSVFSTWEAKFSIDGKGFNKAIISASDTDEGLEVFFENQTSPILWKIFFQHNGSATLYLYEIKVMIENSQNVLKYKEIDSFNINYSASSNFYNKYFKFTSFNKNKGCLVAFVPKSILRFFEGH